MKKIKKFFKYESLSQDQKELMDLVTVNLSMLDYKILQDYINCIIEFENNTFRFSIILKRAKNNIFTFYKTNMITQEHTKLEDQTLDQLLNFLIKNL